MAKKVSNNILKVANGAGGFSGVAAMCGESTYDIARRNGFTGTEAEFLAQYAPDELVQAVIQYKSAVDKMIPPKTAAAHNAIYRGKNLTGVYSDAEICSMISSGTFDDLFIGDYVVKQITTELGGTESVTCYFADFDTFYNNGDTALNRHHAVMVPKDAFKTTAQMNATNTTEGGYFSSKMHQEVLPIYAAALATAFSNHLLTHRSLLSTSMNADLDSMSGNGWKGASNGWEWKDTQLRLMSEIQVYGSNVFSSSFYDIGEANTQFNLFRHNPAAKIAGLGNNGSRYWYWLSAVASATCFADVGGYGVSNGNYASGAGAVRPYFLIG